MANVIWYTNAQAAPRFLAGRLPMRAPANFLDASFAFVVQQME